MTTANLVQVRKRLGKRFGRDVFFASITLMPEEDSPAALKRFADRYKVDAMGPGWTFLTGRPRDIELLRRRRGCAGAESCSGVIGTSGKKGECGCPSMDV